MAQEFKKPSNNSDLSENQPFSLTFSSFIIYLTVVMVHKLWPPAHLETC